MEIFLCFLLSGPSRVFCSFTQMRFPSPTNLFRWALPLGLALLVTGCEVRQETPVIAYTVIQHAVIDLTKGDDAFADTLVKYFGVTRSEGKEVIHYTQDRDTRDKVNADAIYLIRQSLSSLKESTSDASRRRFIVNVMAPYLQCMLHDNAPAVDDRKAIHEKYARLFGTADTNGLSGVATSIQSYRTGGSFHVDSLNLFNRQILPYGLILQLNNRYQQACLLDVTDTILPPRKWKDSTLSVIEAGRKIPCFLGFEYGYSTMKTEYVVVVRDKIRQQAEEYAKEIDTTWLGSFFPDRRFSESLWNSLGIEMTRNEADKIVWELLKRDFKGRTIPEIALALETETAIHEAKHKTDDIDLPTMTINFDCEVSAHLTQAICGNSPFHGLFEAIQRIEGFYANSGDEKMAAILVQLWTIARQAKAPGYPAESLRQELSKVYAGYVAKSSGTPLPDMDEFRRILVPEIEAGVRRAAAKNAE